MDEKIAMKYWKKATIKRYHNIKYLLKDYEASRKTKLSFKSINKEFYSDFLNFCFTDKNHYGNTIHRNIGLLKTFLLWSLKNKYSYNNEFIDFKKPKKIPTREEVLTLDKIKVIFELNLEKQRLVKARDVFVFQCLTGMRYGELKKVNNRTVIDDKFILLKEEKDVSKPTRQIPLSSISKSIIKKYGYNLPLVTNQKQNAYIKEFLKLAGFNDEVEFTRTKGVEQVTFVKKFYERVSTHTARRSFITIMRNKGIADKTIMSISGHRDIRSFNIYHQVDNEAKMSAVNNVFSSL